MPLVLPEADLAIREPPTEEAVLVTDSEVAADVAAATAPTTEVGEALEAPLDAEAAESVDAAAVTVALAAHVAKILRAPFIERTPTTATRLDAGGDSYVVVARVAALASTIETAASPDSIDCNGND